MDPLTRRPSRRAFALFALPLSLAACGGGSTGPEPSPYVLEITYYGTQPSATVRAAFNRAATRVQAIITGALSAVAIPAGVTNIEQCNAELLGHPDFPRDVIRGLDIYVVVENIDGAGQVLGNAGPCLVRTAAPAATALGVMRLDAADLNALSVERLDALILHEMLHVVGLGTIWADNGLLAGDGTADARFTGALARAACANVMGGTTTCATDVPVHSADGEGSAYAHWRESVFTNELMTPFLQAGSSPLSAMSIQSLADLGYQVSTATADPYTVAAGLMALRDADGTPALRLGEPYRARFGVDRQGRAVPLAPRR